MAVANVTTCGQWCQSMRSAGLGLESVNDDFTRHVIESDVINGLGECVSDAGLPTSIAISAC
jgi:hypothetical protein